MEILGRRFEGVENGEGGAEGGREWKRRALRGGGGRRGETTEEVASRGGGGVGGRWVAAVGGILVCVGDVPVLGTSLCWMSCLWGGGGLGLRAGANFFAGERRGTWLTLALAPKTFPWPPAVRKIYSFLEGFAKPPRNIYIFLAGLTNLQEIYISLTVL